MHLLLDSIRRNAEAAQAEATSSPLPNVRDRAARAAAVWETMIERHEAMEARQRAKSDGNSPGQSEDRTLAPDNLSGEPETDQMADETIVGTQPPSGR